MDEFAELRGEVRRFIAAELEQSRVTPSCDGWLCGWDAAFSRRLAQHGWVGMTIPAEYGGSGASALARYVVIEELLAAGMPLAAHWLSDRQVGPSILANGTEEQKRRYLPAIARGEMFFCLGMSEPEAGSDLAAVRTRAERTPQGWLLNGRKTWTSGAHHADAILLLARTSAPGADRHAGLSQFICDLPAPGVQVSPVRLISGEHHFNEVLFENVALPPGALLGKEGSGWDQVTAELGYERSGPERYLSPFPLLARLAADQARTQAGPELDAVLGELLARAWTLRHMSIGIAAALARGEHPDNAAAMVKDLGTTFEQEVVDTLGHWIDPWSGTGDERVSELFVQAMRQSPGFTLRGGATAILRGIVARGAGVR